MLKFIFLRRKGRKLYDSFYCKSIETKAKFGDRFIDTRNLGEKSIVYSGGVGGEISFELSLIKKFNCKIYLFDPTETGINTMMNPVNQNPLIHYYKIGLNKTDSIVEFSIPDNPEEASFRIKRDDATYAEIKQFECKSIGTLMKEFGHKHVDLLKIDIEGFEYGVIEDIIENDLDVRQICVEFHHLYEDIPKARTKASINLLKQNGYRIIHKIMSEYTFVKN